MSSGDDHSAPHAPDWRSCLATHLLWRDAARRLDQTTSIYLAELTAGRDARRWSSGLLPIPGVDDGQHVAVDADADGDLRLIILVEKRDLVAILLGHPVRQAMVVSSPYQPERATAQPYAPRVEGLSCPSLALASAHDGLLGEIFDHLDINMRR